MLIINRKAGEKLTIANNIEIVLISSSNGKCQIGIDAPKSIPIWRNELLPAVKANKEATSWLNKITRTIGAS